MLLAHLRLGELGGGNQVDSVGDYLMSALPLVSLLMMLAVIAVLAVFAVRADGGRRADPQSVPSRLGRLEERIATLETSKRT